MPAGSPKKAAGSLQHFLEKNKPDLEQASVPATLDSCVHSYLIKRGYSKAAKAFARELAPSRVTGGIDRGLSTGLLHEIWEVMYPVLEPHTRSVSGPHVPTPADLLQRINYNHDASTSSTREEILSDSLLGTGGVSPELLRLDAFQNNPNLQSCSVPVNPSPPQWSWPWCVPQGPDPWKEVPADCADEEQALDFPGSSSHKICKQDLDNGDEVEKTKLESLEEPTPVERKNRKTAKRGGSRRGAKTGTRASARNAASVSRKKRSSPDAALPKARQGRHGQVISEASSQHTAQSVAHPPKDALTAQKAECDRDLTSFSLTFLTSELSQTASSGEIADVSNFSASYSQDNAAPANLWFNVPLPQQSEQILDSGTDGVVSWSSSTGRMFDSQSQGMFHSAPHLTLQPYLSEGPPQAGKQLLFPQHTQQLEILRLQDIETRGSGTRSFDSRMWQPLTGNSRRLGTADDKNGIFGFSGDFAPQFPILISDHAAATAAHTSATDCPDRHPGNSIPPNGSSTVDMSLQPDLALTRWTQRDDTDMANLFLLASSSSSSCINTERNGALDSLMPAAQPASDLQADQRNRIASFPEGVQAFQPTVLRANGNGFVFPSEALNLWPDLNTMPDHTIDRAVRSDLHQQQQQQQQQLIFANGNPFRSDNVSEAASARNVDATAWPRSTSTAGGSSITAKKKNNNEINVPPSSGSEPQRNLAYRPPSFEEIENDPIAALCGSSVHSMPTPAATVAGISVGAGVDFYERVQTSRNAQLDVMRNIGQWYSLHPGPGSQQQDINQASRTEEQEESPSIVAGSEQ